jgi:hypothetical protein
MDSVVKQKISGPKNQDVSLEYEITYPDFTQEFCPSSPEEEVNQPEASPAKGVVDEPKATPAKVVVDENVVSLPVVSSYPLDIPEDPTLLGNFNQSVQVLHQRISGSKVSKSKTDNHPVQDVRPKASPAKEDSDDENIVRKKKSDKRKIISDDEDEVVEVPEPSDADDKKLVDAVERTFERIKKEVKTHKTTIENPNFGSFKKMYSVYYILNPNVKKIADSTADQDDELDKSKFLTTLFKRIANEYPNITKEVSTVLKQNNKIYQNQKKAKA